MSTSVSDVEPLVPLSWTRPPEDAMLPSGCSLALDSRSQDLGGGLIAGGTPARLIRLSARGAEQLARWQNGEALGPDPSAIQLASRLVRAGILNPTWSDSTWDARDVTVVIPHLDRASSLDRLLGELDGLAIVVVDDASDDPTEVRSVVARHGADLIEQPRRLGPGAARNAGLTAIQTTFAVFIDSDCTPEPGWLEPLLRQMNDPLVGIVAPRIVGEPGTTRRARFERDCSPLDLGGDASIVRPGAKVAFLPAATLLVRRALGPHLFDASLQGGEDVDLVWRMDDLGWSVRYEPSSVIEHAMRPTMRSWIEQRHFYGRTAAPLASRHGSAAAPLGGPPLSLATWILVGLGHPVAGAALFGVSLERLRNRLVDVTDRPGALAWELSSRYLASSGPALARQVVRTYGPALAVGSLFSRSLRRLSALVALVAAFDRWRDSKTELDLASFVALSTLDDLSYASGVWRGALEERRSGALRPRIVRSSPLGKGLRSPRWTSRS